jgi:hypothetical protein
MLGKSAAARGTAHHRDQSRHRGSPCSAASGQIVANNQEFAWAFDAMASSFDMNRIAPAGALDRKLVVYIWPNAEDLSNN